ncbi:hypothetical protein EON79_05725 [bacterium]|nr:MAG: hypothetical protein EON79_05725 [bacterium]
MANVPLTGPKASRRLWADAAWAVTAAFGAYFCMYAFRKPFTAATAQDFGAMTLWGLDSKALLVTTQVLGYLLSKVVGIRVVSELPPARRALGILGLLGVALASLLVLGLVPLPYSVPAMFVNGLALGMVFGLVLGFLEGRQVSEALIAGLCASFILADGVMKTIGTSLLKAGLSATWMPVAAAASFIPFAGLFVWMLSRVKPPSEQDREHRAPRPAMTRDERSAFLRRYGVGIGLIVSTYVLTTILRSVRSDFAPEIWKGLGYDGAASLFTQSELWVALGVTAAVGFTFVFRDNRKGFLAGLAISVLGFILVGTALSLHGSGTISGFLLMVLIGLGLYLPYVAIHAVLFERLIALTRQRGNLSFLMYVADAAGYGGFVALTLSKSLFPKEADWGGLFKSLCGVSVVLSLLLLSGTAWYFGGLTSRSVKMSVGAVSE